MFGFQEHAFEEVQVLELGSYAAPGEVQKGHTIATSGQWNFHVRRTSTLSPAQSASVISLWDQLPNGETARCHLPGFAFQLMLKGEAVFVAALCWQCNNASIGGSLASESWRAFDATSEAAGQLLELCQEAIALT